MSRVNLDHHNKIFKCSSTHLRKGLYQAISAGIRKSKGSPNNSVLYAYYIKKVNKGKAKKVAIITVTHKLLRITIIMALLL
jgi:transposase